ncbi:transmembrane efflux protein [Acetobacter nitrogenifigens DSM 23921 = NBRC 105050]|uniref:MFS transporter n=1 Tax=Acetobacter nitrogenifigens DSM 23921 = NBRC 105050 TaxID=1120919 RepID=A0A511XCZ7_9PROT|nr:MFS transporter [Acetobacter nitrogenifigens]GBQ91544.1 transmembrane efflux protein [Acetobacter nitrogenifigens DSM 23921 = NBRC 105050]GEN60836.1 MFS transporter [Acetobacter nitrogenifigens DSM 23921 = NBRC 105050]
MNTRLALLALAVGAFGIGTTEFSPMGLLPVLSADLHVSVPAAGMLVTAYALGVMAGAPVVTLLLARFPRKASLVALMGVFTVGNVMSALAPGYDTLLIARVVTSLAHGAFFGLGSIEAASLVAPARRASAIASMFMGLTIANIFGVPTATWVGEAIGWRMAFGATAGLGVLAMAMTQLALPAGGEGKMPAVRQELRVLVRPEVLRALATTVMGAGAMFTLYTYIAPVLAHVTGAGDMFITAMLALVGVGFSIGNAIGGKMADRDLTRSTTLFLVGLGVIMLALPWAALTHVGATIAILLWGAATFALVPPLQMRVMQAAHEAPGLASSINIGAFNMGNALGAALGGAVLSAGLGFPAVSYAGAALTLVGLALVWAGRSRGGSRSAVDVA